MEGVMANLKSFQCSIDGEHWTIINAMSRGAAKSRFYTDLDGDFPFTAIKCRANGEPYTSTEFKRNAEYRGISFAHCGMKVVVNGCNGVIVGHNSSANLDVLFLDGDYRGLTLNCHPRSGVSFDVAVEDENNG
jgi:hypothetical protein